MSEGEADVDKARRRLLRMLVYVPPVVVSTVVVKRAQAQPTSCGPWSCRPRGGGCGPDACPPAGGCPPVGGPCGPLG